MSKFGFVGPSYTAKSGDVADEECINFYPETLETPGAQTQRSYFGTPGLSSFVAFEDGPVRGSCWTGSRLFVVAADTLYEVAADGTQTVWGTVANDGLAVSMVFSNIQLLIVSAGYAYCFTLNPGTWTANTPYPVGTLIVDADGHIQTATAAAWAASTAYAVGAQIVDPNGNIQQAAQAVWIAATPYTVGAEIVDPAGHVQKASAAAWVASTVYGIGSQIVDANGNIQQAQAALWAANTAVQAGTQIVDANGNVQQVTTAGTTGSTIPVWAMSGVTADGSLVWTYQASSGGNAGSSGTSTPAWSLGITFDGKGPLYWVYISSANGDAGTSGATIPSFNDAGGSITEGMGPLIWTDQGAATGAGTSGTDSPDFLLAGNTPDAGTLIWVFQIASNGSAGTSGATIPTFNDAGGTTPDGSGTLVWQDEGLRLLDVSKQLAGTPVQVVYSDGYFVVMFAASNKFQISAILDGTTWPGIQVNAVSVFPDNIVSIAVAHRELWVFGSQHAQPYYDSGSLEIFDVIAGALIETGAAATFGRDIVDNSIFWVGQDIRGARQAWRSNGYTPSRISTHAVETYLASLADISNLVTYSYQDGGHLFWVLYIPGTDCSWVYDVAESLWHKRAEWLQDSGTWGPHRSWNHVYAFNKHLVGDWQTGNLWNMSLSNLDDNGETIRRLRRSPTLVSEMNWIYHSQLTVDFAPGLGPQPPLTDGNGNPRPPLAMLRWSDNRGSTWSSVHTTSVGFAGQYNRRSVWRRLGRSRYRVYELSVSDPIPWAIVDAYLVAA